MQSGDSLNMHDRPPVRPLPFALDYLYLEGDWPRGSAEQALLFVMLNAVAEQAQANLHLAPPGTSDHSALFDRLSYPLKRLSLHVHQLEDNPLLPFLSRCHLLRVLETNLVSGSVYEALPEPIEHLLWSVGLGRTIPDMPWEAITAILNRGHKSLSALRFFCVRAEWSEKDFEEQDRCCRARGILLYVEDAEGRQ